ncbi:ATP-binding cassette domain-containing protein, partial [Oleiphilus sp. HI0123]|uniref:ATP-binding cassette domain-containing protein n=1 Tax=Oleiphilus sp. HI0123 TaxID=1822265 RepID=UPI0007C395D7
MLKIDALTLRRGPEPLLAEANALVHAGQRVAIIGANGAGKTSLFKLILGELSPDSGAYSLPGNCRVSHMAQEVTAGERTAKDYVLDGHQQLRSLEAELKQAEAAHDDHKIAELHGELEHIGAYEAPVIVEKLLHGLGFDQKDMQRPVNDFSGGWRIRLNLAQALMCPSDLLLLDEPTNHLDLDAMLWLEQWLKRYEGTVLFISHDRDIDAVSTHILHFEHKQLNQYTGTYSEFETQRAQKLAQQQSQYEKQQQRISEIQSFVNRFKAKATKAKQAQSRVKELARMELIAPAHIDSPFNFSFPESDKISSPLLSIQKADLGYEQKAVLEDFTTSILPGTRVGLLGPNGAGKSTLIKSLVGDLAQLSGQRAEGEHLRIGYFAQHQLEALDLSASPFLHLQRINPKATDQEIRNFLGGFDFRGDAALETIERFSGGEKARLALAIIAWQKPNLLMLDEPTNHLDLEMRHALTMALQAFQGAILVVSHDRHLLKNTVDTFWLVANGKVEEFKGDLHDYEVWLQDFHKESSKTETVETDSADKQNESAEDKKERKRIAAELRQKLSPLKKKLKTAEKAMEKHQEALAELEEKLAAPEIYQAENKAKLKELMDEQATHKVGLEESEMEWFELSEE